MKRLTYILFLFLLPLSMQAQNHVPNGDFEYYSSCPANNNLGLVNCIGWKSFISFPWYPFATSPDYYNKCSGKSTSSIPRNWLGYQLPHSGNAYIGIIHFSSGSLYREIVTHTIIPLIVGERYEVSLSVSKGDNRLAFSTDNINIFFYDTIGTIHTTNWVTIEPQVTFKQYGVISDTLNWIRLVGYFIADSTYDNIAIGGFLPDTLIHIDTNINFYNPNINTQSYCYIDSVVVRRASKITDIITTDTILCVNDSVLIRYNTNYNFYNGNVFMVQLSDKTGSFSSPINIGTKIEDTSGYIKCSIPDTLEVGSNYKIRVIASNNADTLLDSFRTYSIYNLDTTSISYSSNSPVCESSVLYITSNSSNTNTTYSWTGPSSFYSLSSNPYVTPFTSSATGNYYVISNTLGCIKKDTLQIQIKSSPSKPVATGNTPICQYDSLGLTVNSTTSGVSYSWVGANSFTSNLQNPSILNVPTNAGGMYIATATLNGCSRYDTVSVTVKNAPDTVILSSNSSICTDDTLKLYSDTSTGNVTYTWTGPNNFTSNSKDTFIANSGVANTGWYKMVVNSNGCTYTDSIYALVTQTPGAPSITFNSPICVGENLNLTATGPTNATYNWTGANGFSSTLKNPTRTNITVSDSGNYSVIATLNGCTSLAGSTHVSINPTPFVNILSADSICDGETVTFTALPSNAGSNPQYQWFVNAQLQTAIGSSFTTTTLANNDVIYCEMTDNAKCSVPYTDQSNTKQIKVLPWLAPSVSISSNPTGILQPWEYVTFTATAVNAGNTPQYQWKRNGQNIVGALGSTWAANNLNDNDTISVDLISDYKCPQPTTAKSNSITVSVAVGIDNINKISNIILSPNPNNGQFTLSGTINYNGLAQIEIINMLGQTVLKTNTAIQNNRLHQPINLDGIASGLYLLRLNTNGDVEQIKFRVD